MLNSKLYFVIGLALGIGGTFLGITRPYTLIGIIAVIGIFLFAVRDRIDFQELLSGKLEIKPKEIKESRIKTDSKLTKCPECGSKTKHHKTCSLNPSSKDKKDFDSFEEFKQFKEWKKNQ